MKRVLMAMLFALIVAAPRAQAQGIDFTGHCTRCVFDGTSGHCDSFYADQGPVGNTTCQQFFNSATNTESCGYYDVRATCSSDLQRCPNVCDSLCSDYDAAECRRRGWTPTGDPNNNGCGTCPDGWSPIILNVGRDSQYKLAPTDDPGVGIDLTGDGVPELTTWTAAGSDVGFLWRDLNHNGKCDGGMELFGDAMPPGVPKFPGELAQNGFDVLHTLDANHDGYIDAADAAWTQLLFWRDLNHDGQSQQGEIATLASTGITALDIHYTRVSRKDGVGNEFRYKSSFWLDGKKRTYYDVYFHAPTPKP